MNLKRFTILCIFLVFGLGATAAEKGPVTAESIDSGNESLFPGAGPRAPFWLADDNFRYKIDTLSGSTKTFWGTCIDEVTCVGGDIRGIFTGGDLIIALFNIGRYDAWSGYVMKGPLSLPPPIPMLWLNEIGTDSDPTELDWDTPDEWFHESVNDGLVQGWVAGPGWAVNNAWDPSPTYDMFGTAGSAWTITYYGTHTYPRPGSAGFQWEACVRKNAGKPNENMALYFNGDGTIDNCVLVGITADGYYGVFELTGGTPSVLIPWTADTANLFQDDTLLAGENVFNMVKVNFYTNGFFDIFLNQAYVASAQAVSNQSGYAGFAVYEGISVEHISLDNMTLSTEPLPITFVPHRKVQHAAPGIEAHPEAHP